MRLLGFFVVTTVAALAVPARAETSAVALDAPGETSPPGAAPRRLGYVPPERTSLGTDLGAIFSRHRVSIGLSSPYGWFRDTFGASVGVGIDRHFAIKANLALYDN